MPVQTLKISFLLFVLATFQLTSSFGQKQYKIACVGFYNLENLFDTEDDTTIWDEEYTPSGRKNWDSTKYANKLNNMSKVIAELGTSASPDGLVALGVSEVENRKVLEDLVAHENLKDRNYNIIHYDSPDKRGIDVGLLYQEKYFKVKSSASYELKFDNDPNYKTRDQLLVSGEMDGELVHIIVAHWPSRRGGQAASEPRRVDAAKLGRHIIDSLLTIDPASKIILMGDLNDDPVNVSVKEYIKAKAKISKVKKGDMYNTMYDHYKNGNGTLAWNDAWNLFDQLIISESLTSEDASSYVFHKSVVYNKEYLKQKEGRFKGYPHRTHAGGQYLNGYSDHFPVFMILKKEVKG
ncbi:MAG: endonuclease/exonuclease/phosphatase family protein [Flavobacteriales bacterium]|nr:endonuclease/exonuclease/phosphatase family protein [Flavobacteriales bacterium]